MSKHRIGFSNHKRNSQASHQKSSLNKVKKYGIKLANIAQLFVQSWNLVLLNIAIEVLLNIFIIKNINYTEIDWSTYMAQVSQIFNKTNPTFDYSKIEGPTGPLVYPAGHVFIFKFLYELTEKGTDILRAQYIYAAIYIAQLILVYKIYSHRRVQKVS